MHTFELIFGATLLILAVGNMIGTFFFWCGESIENYFLKKTSHPAANVFFFIVSVCISLFICAVFVHSIWAFFEWSLKSYANWSQWGW